MTEPPEVLPSAADDEYECVLVDPQAARAPAEGEQSGPALCPPGYVPRRKRGAPYRLHGKERVSDDPPEQNPEPPPER